MKETTGKRIKKIMNERGLKQVDVLRLCEPYCQQYHVKLAKNDLSQYINDKVQPKQDKLSVLGLALNVSEAWLMGFDVSRRRCEPAAGSSDVAPVQLRPDEADLLDNYNLLNEEGRKRVRDAAKSATLNPAFLKGLDCTGEETG